MLEMVTSIVTFQQTVVALITNFINGLFTLLLLIPQAVVFITTSIGYLPSGPDCFCRCRCFYLRCLSYHWEVI